MSEEAALAEARAKIADYRKRIERLDGNALDLIFREARNHNWWQDKPVSDDQLREIWNLARYGPTSANSLPARIVFIRSPEAKERLRPILAEFNAEKTMLAPATALIGYDLNFHQHFETTYPIGPEIAKIFDGKPEFAQNFAFQGGTLQGAYFILAVRAVGLDAGAMGGFDSAAADKEFFAGTDFKSNFLCNIGYGDLEGIKGPRLYRWEFDEVCEIL